MFNDCLMDAKNKSNKKSLSSLKGLILLVPYGLKLSNFIDDFIRIKKLKEFMEIKQLS